MSYTIKDRWTGKPLYVAKSASDVREALEEAAKARANLTRADLTRADLTGANLARADLTRADLTGAYLTGADLTRANLTRADLTRADLTGANLARADLTRADLTGANLARAYLADANDPRSPLHPIRLDLWSILDQAPAEVDGLVAALREGRVDGSVYGGECACLVGTIANVRGCGVDAVGLPRLAERPAEQWFMPIRKGDTPDHDTEGAFRARSAVEWIEQWRESRLAVAAALAEAP